MTSLNYNFGIVSLSVVLFTLAACDSVAQLPADGNGTQVGTRQSPGNASATQPSTQTSAPATTPTTPTSEPASTAASSTKATPSKTTAPSQTPTPTSQGPTGQPSATAGSGTATPTKTETSRATAPLPREFEAQWTSVGQGSAETTYRFHRDGSYEMVSVLLQQRASGKFSFIITASGYAAISGNHLTLSPAAGTQAMEDPDAPSRNFNKPLTDLSPDEFLWTFQDGQLILRNQLGSVAYARDQDK